MLESWFITLDRRSSSQGWGAGCCWINNAITSINTSSKPSSLSSASTSPIPLNNAMMAFQAALYSHWVVHRLISSAFWCIFSSDANRMTSSLSSVLAEDKSSDPCFVFPFPSRRVSSTMHSALSAEDSGTESNCIFWEWHTLLMLLAGYILVCECQFESLSNDFLYT